MLNPGGIFLIANPSLSKLIRGAFASRFTSKTVYQTVSKHNIEDLNYLKELVEESKLHTIIDRTLPFGDIVEAHRYVQAGRKKGNLVIQVT